jgi:hypothetical protein
MKLVLALFTITAVISLSRFTNTPVTTCVWPHTCHTTYQPKLDVVISRKTNVAQIETCVWPHKCAVAL